MDTENNQLPDTQESAKSREGTSRRKLLLGGAAAVPVMVTIKSTGASAANMAATPATWWEHDRDKSNIFGSVACIQNVEMPWDCKGAVKDVCEKEDLDWYGYWERKKKDRHFGSVQDGRVMPASYQTVRGGGGDRQRENDERVDEIWDYFYDGGRTHFWPGCKFDVSKDQHCTYVQICLSTACWNSIKTAVGYSGGYDGGSKKYY